MVFYFQVDHTETDWSKEHIFLDQELRAVLQEAELGTRFVDRLVRVTELSGNKNLIYSSGIQTGDFFIDNSSPIMYAANAQMPVINLLAG